jgi:5'(3')-deoxyribonucleotidase
MRLPQPWKPTVLLDVDGVILDFTELYLRCAVMAKVIDPHLQACRWQPHLWDIGDALELTIDARAAVHVYLDAPGAGRTIQPYEGAVDAVRKLMEVADVYFTTTSLETNPTWESDRRWLFTKLLGKDAARRLVFVSHKQLCHGDVLVDDKLSNVEKWFAAHPNRTAVLWPHEYNQQGISDAYSNSTFIGPGFVRPHKRDWDWLIGFVLSRLGEVLGTVAAP